MSPLRGESNLDSTQARAGHVWSFYLCIRNLRRELVRQAAHRSAVLRFFQSPRTKNQTPMFHVLSLGNRQMDETKTERFSFPLEELIPMWAVWTAMVLTRPSWTTVLLIPAHYPTHQAHKNRNEGDPRVVSSTDFSMIRTTVATLTSKNDGKCSFQSKAREQLYHHK